MLASNLADDVRECREPFWLHRVFTYVMELFGWMLVTLFWGLWLRVDGQLPSRGGVLVVATHRTLIDWGIIGSLQPLWLMLFKPSLALWFVADRKNFMFTKFLTWVMSHWQCVPVDRDNKHSVARGYHRIWNLTKTGARVCLFAGGGRERSKEPLQINPTIGFLVHRLEPKVTVAAVRVDGLPLWNGERMHGTNRQKISQFLATIKQVLFRQFQVTITTLDLDDLRRQPDSDQVRQAITQHITNAIRPAYPP